MDAVYCNCLKNSQNKKDKMKTFKMKDVFKTTKAKDKNKIISKVKLKSSY